MRKRALWLLCAVVLATTAVAGLRVGTPHVGRGGIGGGLSGVSPGLVDSDDAPLFTYTAGDSTSGATFSRTSTATYTDASGVIQQARANLLLHSQAFDNAVWTKNQSGSSIPAVTANNAAAPDGTTTAERVVFPAFSSGTTDFSLVVQQPVNQNGVYTGSIWLRGAVGGEVVWLSATPDGSTYVRVRCALTTSWQRFSVSATTAGTSYFWQFGIDRRDASQRENVSASTVYAWQAQVEPGSTATEDMTTTAATNYAIRDAHYISGIRTTLLEGSRTNLALRSEEFDNAAWTKNSSSINANAVSAPNGTVTAETLTGSAAFGNVTQAYTKAGSALAYTGMAFIKAGNLSSASLVFGTTTSFASGASVTFSLTGSGAISGAAGTFGSGWSSPSATITALGSGWYQCTLTATSDTATTLAFAISQGAAGSNGATTQIWGAQLEQAASASSYIPTTSATVTRAVDALTYTLGSYANWTRWEWYYTAAGVLTETVTTGSGSYSFSPTVDRAYRKVVIAKETRDAAYFAGYK